MLHLSFQVLTNHQEDKMLDNTEVSQASIYRNLWIETEASACKLKYELQDARLNTEARDSKRPQRHNKRCSHAPQMYAFLGFLGHI